MLSKLNSEAIVLLDRERGHIHEPLSPVYLIKLFVKPTTSQVLHSIMSIAADDASEADRFRDGGWDAAGRYDYLVDTTE